MARSPAAAGQDLSGTELLEHYRIMRTIREFEERVHRHFALGEIPGFVHLYAGQEAIAAGVCAELRNDDYIASTHRGHGHAIAKGCDVNLMMAELFSRRTGLCKGKGGSMHIADLDVGMLGANGVVGGGIPLACGVGLSAKVRGTDQVGVAFLGDGATNEGTFSETLNLAAVWKAPCLFVIENNGYAESTATDYAVAGGEPHKRAAGYGIPGVRVDGFDFFAVRTAAAEAIARARAGEGPTLIECKAARYYGHFEGDTQTYRGEGEAERLRQQHDPLMEFRRAIEGSDKVSGDDFKRVDEDVVALLDGAIEEARKAPEPAGPDLYSDVYATY